MRIKVVVALAAVLVVSMVGPAVAYPLEGWAAEPECEPLEQEQVTAAEDGVLVEECAEEVVVDPVPAGDAVGEDVVEDGDAPEAEEDGEEDEDGDDAEESDEAAEADKGAAFGACMRDKLLGATGRERFVVCLPLKPGTAHGVRARFAEPAPEVGDAEPEEAAVGEDGDGADEVSVTATATATASKAMPAKAESVKKAEKVKSEKVKAEKVKAAKGPKAASAGAAKGGAAKGGKGRR